MVRRVQRIRIAATLVALLIVAASQASGEEIVIRFFGLAGAHPEIDRPIVERFNEEHTGRIRVEYESGWTEALLARIAAGLQPDVMGLQDPALYSFMSSGALLNLDSFLEKDPVLAEVMHPLTRQRGELDGKLYSLSVATGLGAMQHIVFYYNPRIFAEAGVAPPPMHPAQAWDWDQFVEAARRTTRRDNDGQALIWGFDIPADSRMAALLHTFGARWYDHELKRFDFASEAGMAAVLAFQELVHVHGVTPRQGQPRGGRGGFENGTVAMLIDGSWFPRTTWADLLDGEWSAGVMPIGIGASSPSTWVWGDTIGISSATQHPEAAWTFLRELIAVRWELETRGRFGQLEQFPERFTAENQMIWDFTANYGLPTQFWFENGWEMWNTYLGEAVARARRDGDVHPSLLREMEERLTRQLKF